MNLQEALARGGVLFLGPDGHSPDEGFICGQVDFILLVLFFLLQ